MNVKIWDYYKSKELANWAKGQFEGLTFTHEMPGGMVSASFSIPEKYSLPFKWADVFNQVEIYHGPTKVWRGFVFGLERFWDENNSGIKIDNVGMGAKLNMLGTASDLSNEKGSTFITDHILVAEFAKWISAGTIDTLDYTIPGLREYKPYKTFRQILEDIATFNDYNWYVWDDKLYWEPAETDVTYITDVEHCTGSVRQDLSEFANEVRYSFRNADGTWTFGTLTDEDTDYPELERPESYSDNMTAAQASQLATISLAEHKTLGAVAGVTISKVWNVRGQEIHVSELKPGKVIYINGLIPAKASPSEAFADNDVDTFVIRQIVYNDDNQTVQVSPGNLPQTLPIILNRISQVKK